eukprot:jgi/Tetstr1/458327/TSEL_004292.t1
MSSPLFLDSWNGRVRECESGDTPFRHTRLAVDTTRRDGRASSTSSSSSDEVESMERKIARLATTMDGEVEVAEIPRLDGSLAKIPVSPSFFPRPSPAIFKVSSSPRCPFASF